MRPLTALVPVSVLVLAAGAAGQAAPPAMAAEFSVSALMDRALPEPVIPDPGAGPRSWEPLALPQGHDWEHDFAPYLWLPGIDGHLTVKNVKVPVDVSIGDTVDTLNDLDMAFIAHYEARLGDGGFMADLVYLDLPGEGTLPNGAEAESKLKFGILELGGFVEVQRWDEDPADARACALEIIGGGRVWYAATELDVDALGVHGSSNESWVDPFIGLRVRTRFDERWSMTVRADVGGFDVVNGSDGTWQATATLAYDTSEHGQLGLGWRTLSVDYDHADFEMNTRLSGPFLGYNFRF